MSLSSSLSIYFTNFSRLRLFRLTSLIAVATLPPITLFILARYTPDPLAFSPVGWLSLLFLLVFYSLLFWRFLRHRLRNHHLRSTMLTLILLANPSDASLLRTDDWNWADHFYMNTRLIFNPHAWQASFDLYPDAGLAGFAPLFFRPLVPSHPVTIISLPGEQPNTFLAATAISGPQMVPMTPNTSIWQTLDQHTLRVHHVMMLNNHSAGFMPDSAYLDSIAVNCSMCSESIQVNINPSFLARMAMDGAIFMTGRVPLKGIMTYRDAIKLGLTATDLSQGNFEAASNRLVGLGISKGLGMTTSNNLAMDFVNVQVGGTVANVLVPPQTNPDWEFQIYRQAVGVSTNDFDMMAWQANRITTFYHDRVETSRHTRTYRVTGVDLQPRELVLPPAFQENMHYLQSSSLNIPSITFSTEPISLERFQYSGSELPRFDHVQPYKLPSRPLTPSLPRTGQIQPNIKQPTIPTLPPVTSNLNTTQPVIPRIPSFDTQRNNNWP